MDYNISTQDFYFYYSEVYELEKSPESNILDPILKLFNYKSKYQYIFQNKDCEKEKEETKANIKVKIKEFIEDKKLGISVCDILLYAKQFIDKNINISGNINILNKNPLKYFILKIIDEKTIILDYDFQFIKYIVDGIISIKDCEKFFQNEKYKHIDYLAGVVKGYYFEFSCIYHIIKTYFFGIGRYKEFKM